MALLTCVCGDSEEEQVMMASGDCFRDLASQMIDGFGSFGGLCLVTDSLYCGGDVTEAGEHVFNTTEAGEPVFNTTEDQGAPKNTTEEGEATDMVRNELAEAEHGANPTEEEIMNLRENVDNDKLLPQLKEAQPREDELVNTLKDETEIKRDVFSAPDVANTRDQVAEDALEREEEKTRRVTPEDVVVTKYKSPPVEEERPGGDAGLDTKLPPEEEDNKMPPREPEIIRVRLRRPRQRSPTAYIPR